MGPVAFCAAPNGNILFPAMRIPESRYISQLNGGCLNSWLKGILHILFIKLLCSVFGIERNLLKVWNIYPWVSIHCPLSLLTSPGPPLF